MTIEYCSGSQGFQASDILWTVHAVGNDYRKLAGNPGEEYIRFRSGMVAGHSPSHTHVGFEVVNGAFYNCPYFIEGIPFIGIALDTGEHAEIHVIVSISGTSFFCGAAWLGTIAYPGSVYHVDFRADPFIPVRASFFVAVSGVFHVKGAVFWAGGIAVNVIADFFKRAFIPRVIRDQSFGEVEIILEEAISIYRVKRRIAKKSIRMERRVQGKEIRESRLEGGRIADGFILVRGIGLFFHRHFGMCGLKIIIEKNNVSDNAEAVSEDGKLIGIAEMAVDVELFCIRAGSGL